MTPLDRTVSFTERQHRPVRIGEDLDLDVARMFQVALQVDRRVAEEPGGLTGTAFESGGKLVC